MIVMVLEGYTLYQLSDKESDYFASNANYNTFQIL